MGSGWPYRVIACLSRLVPRHRRDEWRREWDAELRHFEQQTAVRSGAQARLFARSLGAIPDALVLAFTTSRTRGVEQRVGQVVAADPLPDYLNGIPAAFCAWLAAMVTTFILAFAFHGFGELLIFSTVGWAVPAGIGCVTLIWPIVGGLLALTHAQRSVVATIVTGAVGAYVAMLTLYSIGHLLWAKAPLSGFLWSLLDHPLPNSRRILPQFIGLIVGGVVFALVYRNLLGTRRPGLSRD